MNLANNFVKVVALSLLLVAGVATWQYMGQKKQERLELASNAYETILDSLRKNELDKVDTAARLVMKDYKGTTYAPLAALLLAKIAVEKNDLPAAVDHLNFAVTESQNNLGKKSPILHVAKVRLAKVLSQQQKYSEALALLQSADSNGYATLYEDTKGDIYVVQKALNEAKSSYLAAMKAIPQGVNAPWLQLKNVDLNGDKEANVQ